MLTADNEFNMFFPILHVIYEVGALKYTLNVDYFCHSEKKKDFEKRIFNVLYFSCNWKVFLYGSANMYSSLLAKFLRVYFFRCVNSKCSELTK